MEEISYWIKKPYHPSANYQELLFHNYSRSFIMAETKPVISEDDFPLTRTIVFRTKPDSLPDGADKLMYTIKPTFETIADVVDAAEKYVKWAWQQKARLGKITNDKEHEFVYGERIKTVHRTPQEILNSMSAKDVAN